MWDNACISVDRPRPNEKDLFLYQRPFLCFLWSVRTRPRFSEYTCLLKGGVQENDGFRYGRFTSDFNSYKWSRVEWSSDILGYFWKHRWGGKETIRFSCVFPYFLAKIASTVKAACARSVWNCIFGIHLQTTLAMLTSISAQYRNTSQSESTSKGGKTGGVRLVPAWKVLDRILRAYLLYEMNVGLSQII